MRLRPDPRRGLIPSPLSYNLQGGVEDLEHRGLGFSFIRIHPAFDQPDDFLQGLSHLGLVAPVPTFTLFISIILIHWAKSSHTP